MKNVRKLVEAESRFSSVGISHDLTPKQREEIKFMIADAKKKHVENNSDDVENYRFIVVGRLGFEKEGDKSAQAELTDPTKSIMGDGHLQCEKASNNKLIFLKKTLFQDSEMTVCCSFYIYQCT